MAKNLFPKPRLITVQQWACSQATNAKAPHFAKSDFLFAVYHWPHWLRIHPRGGFGASLISISMPEAMKDGCGDDVENQPGAVVDREDFGFPSHGRTASGDVSIAGRMRRLEAGFACGARRSQARGLSAAILSLPSRRIS
jgi:hypothetical protein